MVFLHLGPCFSSQTPNFAADVKIPRLISGFWEFLKDSKVIPIHVQNSQEFGKFPASNHTGT